MQLLFKSPSQSSQQQLADSREWSDVDESLLALLAQYDKPQEAPAGSVAAEASREEQDLDTDLAMLLFEAESGRGIDRQQYRVEHLGVAVDAGEGDSKRRKTSPRSERDAKVTYGSVSRVQRFPPLLFTRVRSVRVAGARVCGI